MNIKKTIGSKKINRSKINHPNQNFIGIFRNKKNKKMTIIFDYFSF
jgi:hypothetical protein